MLITGASQGIGEAAALRFAEEGARVAVNGRHEDKLRAVVDKLPKVDAGPHVVATGDMSKEDDVDRVMRTSLDEMGGLDVLICNAGIMRPSPSEDITLDDLNAVLAVNLTSVILCSRAVLKYWRSNDLKGSILVNSSVHQEIPKPQYLGYSASKGAVGNVVRTLALEYAAHGIRVNGVGPGAIVTPMNDAWVHDPEQYKTVSSHIPMGRPGEGREIADALTFLASEEASYITGQMLYVDGGLTLYADFQKNWSS
ncbi:NAD/NADP-dependent glucose 1-dehydrogenase [Neoasaia chiangmaiensis NBRC 101099]|nr:NAD/NADP-dependent glucose 1-dehydrogenase [Neoasaia chiangmaiensis NBRC 101099]GEN15899.1 glucose-1-dehydrogenase [Neoasaia chiangmaiensis]